MPKIADAAPRQAALAAATALALLCCAPVRAQDMPPPEVSAVPIPDGQIDRALGELDKLAIEHLDDDVLGTFRRK